MARWNANLNIALGFVLGSIFVATWIALYQSPNAAFDVDTLGKVATVLVAPFSLALVLLTAVLARETRAMWVKNREPHLVVTIEPTAASLMFVDLVVENIGGGAAFSIETTFDPDLEVADQRGPFRVSSRSIVRAPILKPRQRIATFLGQWSAIAPRRTTVKCTCRSEDGTLQEFSNVIDLASYAGISQLGEHPIQKTAYELEQLRKAVEKLATGWSRLEVNIHDADDRAAEAAKLADEHRAFMKQTSVGQEKDPMK
jgi:hypothetical protein